MNSNNKTQFSIREVYYISEVTNIMNAVYSDDLNSTLIFEPNVMLDVKQNMLKVSRFRLSSEKFYALKGFADSHGIIFIDCDEG